MKTFTEYLRSKNYRPKTLQAYTREGRKFQQWLADHQLKVEELTYKNLLQLIRHSRAAGRNRQEVNKHLHIAEKYINYQISEGNMTENPVTGLRIKGPGRRLPHDLVEWEDLEALYNNYPVTDAITQRNKILLGLMVHQGLKLQDIEKLETSHLKLHTGTIYVPGGRQNNSRTLQLDASQILPLQEYIQNTREQLMEAARKRHFKCAQRDIRTLFFGTGGGKAEGTLSYFLRHLKPPLTVVRIRNSVIAHWLKSKDIRVVQYMAGHKYVSSTERFRAVRLEDLQESLKKFHPLNKTTS